MAHNRLPTSDCATIDIAFHSSFLTCSGSLPAMQPPLPRSSSPQWCLAQPIYQRHSSGLLHCQHSWRERARRGKLPTRNFPYGPFSSLSLHCWALISTTACPLSSSRLSSYRNGQKTTDRTPCGCTLDQRSAQRLALVCTTNTL